MSNDDKINWLILVVTLVFVGVMVPLQLQQDHDARFGAETKNVLQRLMK